jgi:ribosomal protein L34E
MIDFRNLAKIFVRLRPAPKMCAACGQGFECGAKLKSCWCAEIETTAQTRAELQDKYQGCLCRECLEKAAGEK